jgi:glycoside/pentoside/hexuronide:cation symporter, GPH family
MNDMSAERKLLGSRRTKLFYGFGSVAYGVKDHGFQQLLLFYYNQVVGLPARTVGTAILLVLLIDAFADPIVGQISDNLRTRWGRRHPFMYASALPVAFSYYFLWTPPHWSQGALFFYLVGLAIVVRTFITLYEIPSSALVPEMTDNYDQRTSFLSYRYFFGVIGGAAMGFATFRIFLRPDAVHPVGQLNPAGYPSYAIAAAIVMVVSILISARGTHRFIPFFRVPPARRPSLGQIMKEMFVSLSHPAFMILVSAAIFGTVAIGLGTSLMIYFNTYFWGLSSKQIAIFQLVGLFSATLGPALAGPLSKRFEKHRAVIAFFVCFILVTAMPISLRLVGFFPPNGSIFLVPILFLERSVSGVLGIATLILFGSMMADVVDDSAVRTGRRSEGLFFAAMSFIAKFLSGAGTFLATQLLFFAGFPEHARPETIDPTIVRHLAYLYLPSLVLLYGTGMLLLSRYRISRSQHENNLIKLSESEAFDPTAPCVESASAEKQVDYAAAKAASGLGG